MNHPVIAIGLDAADPLLIETWMSQGHLKNLKQLCDRGLYTRLKTFNYYRAETPWTTFLTGCSPQNTGYWAPVKFHEGTYEVEEIEAYDFSEHPPFYALGDDYQVAVFDMPQSTLSEQVNGLQVLAWGAHSPLTPSHSKPAGLLEALIQKHGEHPRLRKDHASCMNVAALKRLQSDIQVGIARRSAICQDLLQRQPWDLFLTIFGETHSAGHYLWHLSQPSHPLYETYKDQVSGDPLLEVFESVDRAIGEILDKAPKDAQVVVFAAHGMGNNVMDLPSMVFLPELLYRFNFGKPALAPGQLGAPPSEPITKGRVERGWIGAVWGLKHDANRLRSWLRQKLPNKLFKHVEPLFGKDSQPDLVSPFKLIEQGDALFFQPAVWYKPFWSQMRAFALPSYSEGYIRINLKGREPEGIVEPSEYEALCDELSQLLYNLKDARTGQPMVKQIVRTRQQPDQRDPKLPDADLVIIWQEEHVTDVVDSPELGRIGPVPYSRTGSHRSDGFLMAQGPGIEPGSSAPEGHALDLAPTVLSLMGASIPPHFEGRPLIETLILAK
ncbi:alkaline phosphatase family protein [Oculatella sp. FACHB-28]|uniref:alkaline phosphatase family protein n=1 Tax=Oculatella sp. FACHB-28 TaxID=2692845 RepID=UPI00168315E9|nr:alkaline phosphatase family protein [Oculatella sp. FACHB-28]MBD2059594.1 alkaline phosphatase family protein [Oculatella sp. FACHB-28]